MAAGDLPFVVGFDEYRPDLAQPGQADPCRQYRREPAPKNGSSAGPKSLVDRPCRYKPKNNLVAMGHLAGLTAVRIGSTAQFKPLPGYRS